MGRKSSRGKSRRRRNTLAMIAIGSLVLTGLVVIAIRNRVNDQPIKDTPDLSGYPTTANA